MSPAVAAGTTTATSSTRSTPQIVHDAAGAQSVGRSQVQLLRPTLSVPARGVVQVGTAIFEKWFEKLQFKLRHRPEWAKYRA
jgi:hypothetical protein